ncbi:MAG TPA: signal peptidase I [Mycobacteriales bacterium]|jgi:signal peptidase I|nr:signal peptidase I [Mycobacteriales bacterium]
MSLTEDDAGAAPPQVTQRPSTLRRELPFLVLIALVLALLIKTFLVQAFFIPSGSMERTLHGCTGCRGDRVLVNKLVYRIRDPHRGEIVVFKGPPSWQPEFVQSKPGNPVSRFLHEVSAALGVAAPSNKDFIKRVIGIGGDHVVCCDSSGRITVNGRALNEPYLYPGAHPSDQPFDVVVPKGRLWVMGDHRNDSADSRAHQDDHLGTIPVNDVIGRAFVRVWPPNRWGMLPVPKTFQQHGLVALGLPVFGLLSGASWRWSRTRRRRSRRRTRPSGLARSRAERPRRR